MHEREELFHSRTRQTPLARLPLRLLPHAVLHLRKQHRQLPTQRRTRLGVLQLFVLRLHNQKK